MGTETMLIVPAALAPGGASRTHQTPFGSVLQQEGALLRAEGTDGRALIYAAKAAGAKRLLAADLVQPLSPLLESGDLVVPSDTIDQTRLRPFTFFENKGYGFIKLNPPFCPVLMERLYAAAGAITGRAFRRATYVGKDGPRDLTPAEGRMFRQWGGDIAGDGLLPECYLARELEICYAAITAVDQADLLGVLRRAAAATADLASGAKEQPCGCRQSMAFAKAQGLVGEDWRTWL
jgi:5'-methylthioadenosine phosphorylase